MSFDNTEILKIKHDLDIINYGVDIPLAPKENDRTRLDKYSINNCTDDCVNKDIENIRDKIKNTDLHIGVISAGTHTLDYQRVFNFEPEEGWSDKPVMFLYECPAANLNCSFYGEYDDKFGKFQFKKDGNGSAYTAKRISEETDYDNLLCNHIWRVNPDPAVKCDRDFKFFGNKRYDEFILSVIKTFKLANFYTTNFFRYELYRINGEKESALNFGAIQNATGDSVFPTQSFTAELDAFNPKVIFATSNPYNWLINNWNIKFKDKKQPLIIKVPHPANRDTCPDRFLKNALAIKAGLEISGVITKGNPDKTLESIYAEYVTMLTGDYKEGTAEA